jgi:hypothetical protein
MNRSEWFGALLKAELLARNGDYAAARPMVFASQNSLDSDESLRESADANRRLAQGLSVVGAVSASTAVFHRALAQSVTQEEKWWTECTLHLFGEHLLRYGQLLAAAGVFSRVDSEAANYPHALAHQSVVWRALGHASYAKELGQRALAAATEAQFAMLAHILDGKILGTLQEEGRLAHWAGETPM